MNENEARYYDPEYDREVGEEVIKSQYDWFVKQSWFNKSYEEFRESNFIKVSISYS